MRKSYKVYMILENGSEQFLEKAKTEKEAEMKCRIYEKHDQYERSIGYHVPATKYIYKF